MEWKPFPDQKPVNSGTAVVSVKVQFPAGIVTTSYTAYYDSENDRWYKYDPFSEKKHEEDDITENVLSWVDGLGFHVGNPKRL